MRAGIILAQPAGANQVRSRPARRLGRSAGAAFRIVAFLPCRNSSFAVPFWNCLCRRGWRHPAAVVCKKLLEICRCISKRKLSNQHADVGSTAPHRTFARIDSNGSAEQSVARSRSVKWLRSYLPMAIQFLPTVIQFCPRQSTFKSSKVAGLRGCCVWRSSAEDLQPAFQPLLDLRSRAISGFEILARWTDPVHGSISPADFIPVAEAEGLLGPMTESLLRRACTAAMAWPSHLTLAINISPLQLQDPDLAAMIRRAVEPTGFPLCRLEIELTEQALVGPMEIARAAVHELKSFGVCLVLDDFGTGYAGLNRLQQLPFDKLKIDGSFIRGLDKGREGRKIVAAMISLGLSLGRRDGRRRGRRAIAGGHAAAAWLRGQPGVAVWPARAGGACAGVAGGSGPTGSLSRRRSRPAAPFPSICPSMSAC